MCGITDTLEGYANRMSKEWNSAFMFLPIRYSLLRKRLIRYTINLLVIRIAVSFSRNDTSSCGLVSR